MTDPTVERPTAAMALPTEALFSDAERAALVGFLAGYSGQTRVAYTLDMRQYTSWCATHGLHLFAAKRADIECYASELEAKGRARATIARRLCTVAGFYRYAVEGDLLDHSSAAHVRRPGLDYESHATALDRNEVGALLVAAGLGDRGRARTYLAADTQRTADLRSPQHRPSKPSAANAGIGRRPCCARAARSRWAADGSARRRPHRAPRCPQRRARRQEDQPAHRAACVTAALDAGVPLRDVQEAASRGDPRTTMLGQLSLDRHATYIVAAYLAGAAR